GGKVEVFVEAVAPDGGGGVARALLEGLLDARRAHRQVVLVTPLDGSAHRLVPVVTGQAAADDADAVTVAEVARRDQAEVIDGAGGARLFEPQLAPLRLIIVGAVHVAQPLAEMAGLA